MSEDTEKTTDVAKEEIAKEQSLVLQQLERDYALPWQQQKALIRTENPDMLTEVGVKSIVTVARTGRMPLYGINAIVNKRGDVTIFVNSDGIRWKLHIDPRGIKHYDGEITHLPKPDEPYVFASGIVEFKDGSTFTNAAAIYFKHVNGIWFERSRKGEWNEVSLGDRVMACLTKAKRRSGVDAVGVGLPIFEDMVSDTTEIEDKNVTVIPGNLFALLQDISRRGVPVADVIAKLGVNSIEKLADDLTGAWQVAIELQKQKNGS